MEIEKILAEAESFKNEIESHCSNLVKRYNSVRKLTSNIFKDTDNKNINILTKLSNMREIIIRRFKKNDLS